MNELLKQLRATFGLEDDAGQDAVVAKAKEMAEAAQTLPAVAEALGLGADAKAETVAEAAKQAAAEHGGGDRAKTVKTIATALGLGEDATGEQVVAKVGDLAKAAAGGAGTGEPDPNKFVPREMYDGLADRVKQLETASVEGTAQAKVDRAVQDGKVTPAQKEWALTYAKADPQGFDKFVEAQPVIATGGELLPSLKPRSEDGGLSPQEKSVAKAMGLSEEEMKKSREALAAREKETDQ